MSSFEFKKNCFICADLCAVVPDPKHPSRWEKNKGILCQTADRGSSKQSFKEVLLQLCNERNDAEADTVRVRLAGAPSDLHAADARYPFFLIEMIMVARSWLFAQG